MQNNDSKYKIGTIVVDLECCRTLYPDKKTARHGEFSRGGSPEMEFFSAPPRISKKYALILSGTAYLNEKFDFCEPNTPMLILEKNIEKAFYCEYWKILVGEKIRWTKWDNKQYSVVSIEKSSAI